MKPYQNRKKGHMKMYQIDFNKPIHIHFMGIGGISMSGLAEILIKEGFTISGSDVHTSDIIKHLEDKGAKVYLSQTADNITDDIDLVVYTAALLAYFVKGFNLRNFRLREPLF